MKRQNILKSIFLLLVVSTFTSSCGLIEKFRTPEQPTDSKSSEPVVAEKTGNETDDLFSQAMNDANEQPLEAKSDAPANISNENLPAEETLKSLEDEFADNAAKPEPEAEPGEKQVKVEEALPEITSELPSALAENTNSDAGKVMSYKVQKGETLMQIAFKIYGDVSKWKELKQMNGDKLSRNSALRSNMELKYTAPAQEFVWNPEGTPYMIKNGETLGTISNSVYQTPKKWKDIWENNKPLIKNPNVIYAGFTLYYKGNGMANYVQPEATQRKLAAKAVEEVKVEQAVSEQQTLDSSEVIDEIPAEALVD